MLSGVFYWLAQGASVVLNLMLGVLIISIGISWFQADPRNQFVATIHSITEPIYRPFRLLTRKIPGPFDFAPTLAIMIIVLLQKSLPIYLMTLSMQFK